MKNDKNTNTNLIFKQKTQLLMSLKLLAYNIHQA